MNDSTVTVGIICPVPIEYQICRDSLKLIDEVELAGRHTASRTNSCVKRVAIQLGPGKIQRTLATQLLIDRFGPDVIIDTGGAGVLSPNLNLLPFGEASFTSPNK